MPILDSKPGTTTDYKTTKKTDDAITTDAEYIGSTVDSKYQNHSSLITHISGSSWVTTYYSQIIGENEELSPLQTSRDPIYQQYMKIEELELKVSSALSQDQDSETGIFEISGAATIYPPLIPNHGDMFVADIGDGVEGLFTLTSVRRMSILKEPCYEVEYNYISKNVKELRRDLQRKTIKETHFVKHLMAHGEEPIIVKEEYHKLLMVDEYLEKLTNNYVASFFSKKVSSFIVPGQQNVTFDPFLVSAFTSIMDVRDNVLLRGIKNYSIELSDRTPPRTLWDALLQNTLHMLPMCNEKLALVSSTAFSRFPQFEGVYFSNVEDVVYPIDRDNDDLIGSLFKEGHFDKVDIRHQFETSELGDISQLASDDEIGTSTLQPIFPVTKDDYYVFSESFYFPDAGEQSQLEAITRSSLEGKSIDRKVLFELCDDCHKWNKLDRFYYVLILIILLKLVKLGQ